MENNTRLYYVIHTRQKEILMYLHFDTNDTTRYTALSWSFETMRVRATFCLHRGAQPSSYGVISRLALHTTSLLHIYLLLRCLFEAKIKRGGLNRWYNMENLRLGVFVDHNQCQYSRKTKVYTYVWVRPTQTLSFILIIRHYAMKSNPSFGNTLIPCPYPCHCHFHRPEIYYTYISSKPIRVLFLATFSIPWSLSSSRILVIKLSSYVSYDTTENSYLNRSFR